MKFGETVLPETIDGFAITAINDFAVGRNGYPRLICVGAVTDPYLAADGTLGCAMGLTSDGTDGLELAWAEVVSEAVGGFIRVDATKSGDGFYAAIISPIAMCILTETSLSSYIWRGFDVYQYGAHCTAELVDVAAVSANGSGPVTFALGNDGDETILFSCGADVWGSTDQLHYGYRTLQSDEPGRVVVGQKLCACCSDGTTRVLVGGYATGGVFPMYIGNGNEGVSATGKSIHPVTAVPGGFSKPLMAPEFLGARVYLACYVDSDDSVTCGTVSLQSIGGAGTDPVILEFRHPLVTVIEERQQIIEANPDTPLGDKAEDALAKTVTALEELAKTPPDNQAAVGNIEGAVGDLEAAVKDELLDLEQGTKIVNLLTDAGRQLAGAAVDQAIAAGADADRIAEAEQALAQGDELREQEAFKDAVNKYKDALAKSEGAM